MPWSSEQAKLEPGSSEELKSKLGVESPVVPWAAESIVAAGGVESSV